MRKVSTSWQFFKTMQKLIQQNRGSRTLSERENKEQKNKRTIIKIMIIIKGLKTNDNFTHFGNAAMKWWCQSVKAAIFVSVASN